MLIVDSLRKSFAEQELLAGINFSLKDGEFVGLLGPSGGGKSVLLKIIGGVGEAYTGQVSFLGDDGTPRDLARSTGFLFQSGALFDSMTVLENTMFPLEQLGEVSYREAGERAYELLSIVGLSQAIAKLPGQLSGGMRRRVALARALVTNPELALLDDPTAGLDPVAANVIMELIQTLHQRYHPTIIIVSHDLRRMIPRVERVLCLFDGQIKYDGAPSAIANNAPKEVRDFISTRYDFVG